MQCFVCLEEKIGDRPHQCWSESSISCSHSLIHSFIHSQPTLNAFLGLWQIQTQSIFTAFKVDSTLEDIISQGENGSLRLCPMASWSLCLRNMRNDCSEKGSINSHWFANAGITADSYHHRQQVASGCICWCSTPAPQKPEPGRRCARGEGAVKCRECLAEESQ